MFFRFASAVTLVVLVSLAGIALEKRTLELRRRLTRQHFQTEVLLEAHAKLRLRTQQLGATDRLLDALDREQLRVAEPQATSAASSTTPLLRWQAIGRESRATSRESRVESREQ